MANPELVVNLADSDSDDNDDAGGAAGAAGAAPGQPRRDRLERIALFDFLRLVAGNREPQPGFRTIQDLVAHLKANETLTSESVSRAMLSCPRDLFVPHPHRGEALVDRPIRVEAAGFNISAPHVQAVSLQALALETGQRVLDVGCGCGIVTAYAAYLTGSSGEVVGIDIRDAAISLATSNLERLRAQSDEFSELAAPIRLERHNVFVPLRRHLGSYDAVHVGGAMQESRLGAIIDLLGPRGGRIVAPVASELRLITKYPDGSVQQKVLSQVSFSELEVPRDVEVVRALLQENAEEARRVEVPPSTFASDLAHLAAPGVDLAALAVEEQAPGPGSGPGPSSSSGIAVAAAATGAGEGEGWFRRGANGVRPRSFTSLLSAHTAPATLPPAHRPSGRDGGRGPYETTANVGGGSAASDGQAAPAARASGGWGWQWDQSAAPPLPHSGGGSGEAGGPAEGATRGDEAGRRDAGAGVDVEAGEKQPLLTDRAMEEAAAAPAGPVEAEPAEAVGPLAGSGPVGGEPQQRTDGDGGLSYLSGVADVLKVGPTDCELEGAGWRLPSHKAVLQARCELLRAHMGSGMRDSDATRYLVPEVVERRDAVEAFLHYVYKDRLPDNLGTEVIPQLLHAGIYFGCNRLVRLCEALLARELLAASAAAPTPAPASTSALASASRGAGRGAQGAQGRGKADQAGGPEPEELAAAVAAAGPLLALADEGGLDQLRRVALNFVLDHFPAVSASEGYRQLPRPLLEAVTAEAVGRYDDLLAQLARLGQQPQGLGDPDY